MALSMHEDKVKKQIAAERKALACVEFVFNYSNLVVETLLKLYAR